ncbi:MAG: sugar ABC transporter permease [Chloroflexi bacterium]|nr:sugar ABC transporter permease [Chloroflexota bacterium]
MSESTLLVRGRRSHAWSAARWRDTRDGYFFILPWLLGFVIWTAGPMIASVIISFTDWRIVTTPHFVGLANFAALLQDPRIRIALFNTAYYVILGVPTHLILALVSALLLNLRLRGIAVYRTLFYLPFITPLVANALLWLWIFNTDFGLANWLLTLFHLPSVDWLQDPRAVKNAFIIMSWWTVGGQMVILLAGLQGIPQHLYEAAGIDGAGRWARFRHVTLPLLTPSLFFNLTLAMIGAFQVFVQAYVMTSGGPEDASLFYVLYLYRVAFQNFDMGYASAMAWLLFVIILIITLIQFRFANRWVYYEAELKG